MCLAFCAAPARTHTPRGAARAQGGARPSRAKQRTCRSPRAWCSREHPGVKVAATTDFAPSSRARLRASRPSSWRVAAGAHAERSGGTKISPALGFRAVGSRVRAGRRAGGRSGVGWGGRPTALAPARALWHVPSAPPPAGRPQLAALCCLLILISTEKSMRPPRTWCPPPPLHTTTAADQRSDSDSWGLTWLVELGCWLVGWYHGTRYRVPRFRVCTHLVWSGSLASCLLVCGRRSAASSAAARPRPRGGPHASVLFCSRSERTKRSTMRTALRMS